MPGRLDDDLDRVLIVGMGSIGKRHARVARQVAPDVHIAAWRHQPGEDVPEGADQSVHTLEGALTFAPQLAVIASPASKHLETAIPLAESGVHLLVEKPISHSADGVDELISACRSSGVTLAVGYNLRFLPSLTSLRDLLEQGRVGRVLSVRAEVGQYLPSWRPRADYRQGVSAQEKLGGGVLLELSHEIDYLRWLFGEVEWVSATARRQSSLEIDVEDTAHLVMGFQSRDGEPSVVANLNMDFVRHDATRTCTVIGETASLRWDARAGTVELFEPASAEWEVMFSDAESIDGSYIAEWRHVLTCVESGAHPVISGEDGWAAVKIVDAARASSTNGCVVSLSGATDPLVRDPVQ